MLFYAFAKRLLVLRRASDCTFVLLKEKFSFLEFILLFKMFIGLLLLIQLNLECMYLCDVLIFILKVVLSHFIQLFHKVIIILLQFEELLLQLFYAYVFVLGIVEIFQLCLQGSDLMLPLIFDLFEIDNFNVICYHIIYYYSMLFMIWSI